MSKLHGAAKRTMWMAHAPLFSHDDGPVADPTGGTGVESDPNQGSVGVLASQANPNPADLGSFGVFADQANAAPTQGPVNTNPSTSPGGLLADFKKQTSTVAGLQNLLTQATASGTTIAQQVAPLTKKGKKNAAATAGKVDTTKDKSKIPTDPTKILGMSVPVFGVVAFLVVGGIVVGGLYAAGVIGGGSSSATTTVPLVPNLVSKAA